MLKRTITFHNLEHSPVIEKHANEKINKIEEMLKDPKFNSPKHLEMFLKANKQHTHHTVDLKLKTPQFDLFTSYEDPDMYMAIDTVIDKMVTVLKKEKDKLVDKKLKKENEKKVFADDKYNL